MENKTIARTLRLLSQLMELQEENPFKVKSVANAAFKVDKSPVKVYGLNLEQLEKVEGIGKSIALKIDELNRTGAIDELTKLLAITPDGIIEMLSIKGLGPKKIQIIWKQLGIENIVELYYACNENRLVEAKGFGLKTQEEIKKVIEFTMSNIGKLLYAQAEELNATIEKELLTLPSVSQVATAGQMARKCDIIETFSFVIASENSSTVLNAINNNKNFSGALMTENQWNGKFDHFSIEITFSSPQEFTWNKFKATGSSNHIQHIEALESTDILKNKSSEAEIYQTLNWPYIIPELREEWNEEKLKSIDHNNIIVLEDLKGTIHNHSTYSDGIHTLKDMALYCKELGYDYLGICDHSKSAFYANGLTEERVAQQHAEIEKLNQELAPFKIFKGIESDILYDGSLDYSDEILDSFDLVVASVHSQLKMTKEKANERLIKAIENPYTTILGHPTGRLLLAREGYPLDHKLIIDACAANNVVIELNSNPLRLDLDWRWIDYALSKNVMISINPDAHRKEGYHDMKYGVNVARKAGLTKNLCFNALSANEIARKFEQKKSSNKKI
ncbi:DNA polymerase/3'-5' exonuclease PolX [Solitalea lacus]|uniref:DNA polymerase/3'-5' exonuclease PolX n=1 Tax=Solitalea lacus TaxID=2911172 RepID=UPI001EDB03DB|nr:DNA polymerase/3'-5' exonuclease PolX [Solitalea lacus]UKJ06384.1 helix-hairpin-helix domain-containing protein [Solitalea lacus]